jgi:hypothetical protein
MITATRIKRIILADKACFTLKNLRTGYQRTYKMKRDKEPSYHNSFYVMVLDGPDISDKFVRLGILNAKKNTFRHTIGTDVKVDSMSFKSFDWFRKLVLNDGVLPSHIQFIDLLECPYCGCRLKNWDMLKFGMDKKCAKQLIGSSLH